MQSISENDFECFASTGVNTPETISPPVQKNGLRDKVAGNPRSRLTATVKAPGPIFGAKVLLAPNRQANGIEIKYLPQVGFAEENSEKWVWYLAEELSLDVIRALKPRSRVQYIVFFTLWSCDFEFPMEHCSRSAISRC
jgi:hypothetical protein